MKVREELLQQEEELLRRKILGVDGENLLSKVPSPPSPFASSDPASAPERAASPFPDRHAPGDTALIDLNRASEEQIASLPGINLIMAKRAVSLRDARGGFDSLEDFSHALGLKPHIKERIRPMVGSWPQSSGRIQHLPCRRKRGALDGLWIIECKCLCERERFFAERP